VTARAITRLAMAVAGIMLAHQTASKAVREAVFLSGPGVEKLPLMVILTAAAVVLAVPVWARLLARFGPRTVVPAGFLVSAAAHLIEWTLPAHDTRVAAAVYLHVAGFGALLLSGFWSLVSELFDTNEAKRSYGLIAAAGTLGGLAGGGALLAVSVDSSLAMLAALHVLCAGGVWILAREARVSTLLDSTGRGTHLFDRKLFTRAPYLATLALLVVLSSASAGIVDFLFKQGVSTWIDSREALQTFFALFYMSIGALTFGAQTAAASVIRTFGIGRSISTLPVGLSTATALALITRTFPFIVITRGIEAVLRGSWFRSGYELLFVPMAPDEKRHTKTFLDVTCDRAGDALGAMVVQAALVAAVSLPALSVHQRAGLLAVVLLMAAAGIVLSRRVDKLYIGVVASRLADQKGVDEVAVQSETGWTLLELPVELRAARAAAAPAAPAPSAGPVDPYLKRLADLRSGDRARVEAALKGLTRPDPVEVTQLLQLLAWDDLAPRVRLTLERVAPQHIGLLSDTLTDREIDFSIRRRIPKILGNVGTAEAAGRALTALMSGLEDPRFEVRYQSARAMNRLMARTPGLSVDRDRILAIVERELSVPIQVWQGHRLLDQGEPSEDGLVPHLQIGNSQRNIEHIFSLLATILPREPLQAAFRGIQSADPELRALTLEYFEGVLPPPVLARLWALPYFDDPTPSSGGAP
jgi:ATP:ADP antiporter, AAA family